MFGSHIMGKKSSFMTDPSFKVCWTGVIEGKESMKENNDGQERKGNFGKEIKPKGS